MDMDVDEEPMRIVRNYQRHGYACLHTVHLLLHFRLDGPYSSLLLESEHLLRVVGLLDLSQVCVMLSH